MFLRFLPVWISFLICFFSLHIAFAQISLDYYLPDGINYNQDIPTPEELLGYQVGKWHVSHDQLVFYMKAMAAASDRIVLEEIGRTYENRPLIQLIITHPDNHQRLEEIRKAHVELSDPSVSEDKDISGMPVVVHMGYSIHGNEASGSNASLLVVYYLAAAEGRQIDQLLKDEVIIVDPSFNPDGMNRFSHWVNSHRSIKSLNADGNSREHNEVWPGGRTNHYWFDLNRDWLPVQHPESRARVARFHHWKYNYQTDHHEMGTNSTFFFQPGIPSRTHPLTPQKSIDLTYKMANYYAAAMDSIGSLYFTEEEYDDFFYGKGSTYPDINGAVGILFEQASSRGHVQENDRGLLPFHFTIRNQFTASLATLKGTHALRQELLEHQRSFYLKAMETAENDPLKAYVVSWGNDHTRGGEFAGMLQRHEIKVYENTREIEKDGYTFQPGQSAIIPLEQPQHLLIKAIFERRTEFQDSLFYDISAWTMPMAFGLQFAELDRREFDAGSLGDIYQEVPGGGIIGGQSHIGYLMEWHDYHAPLALNKIMQAGFRVKVATQPFGFREGKNFDYGTVLIPVDGQDMGKEEIFTRLNAIAQETGVEMYGASSGYTTGVRLGSETFKSLELPKIALVVGDGVSSYEAGEVWHLLDYRYEMDITLLPAGEFRDADLSRYNTLILVNGTYNGLADQGDRIREWVAKGGVIVATKSGVRQMGHLGFSSLEINPVPKDDRDTVFAYEDKTNIQDAQKINGAICHAHADLTHPICFGLGNDRIQVFRNSRIFLKKSNSPFANPVMYADNPLASGYLSDENRDALKGTAAVAVVSAGRGRVVAITDNPNFRAFWYGTNKLFINSIWFGRIVN